MAAAAKCIALLLLAMAVGGTHAQSTTSTVSVPENTGEGGERFNKDVRADLAKDQLDLANTFLYDQLYAQQPPSDRKTVTSVSLVVANDIDEAARVDLETNTIFLSSDYISGYKGEIVREVFGIEFQGVAAIWQWTGNNQAPAWWFNGVAQYFRLRVGFAPEGFAAPGSGDTWEEQQPPNGVTARFIEYLETVTSGFVGKLNAKIKTSWNIGYFKDVTGKSVDELWKDYKAKYAK